MKKYFSLFLILFPLVFYPQNLKSPEEVFGFKLGSDCQLIDWNQIAEYIQYLGKNSEKIVVKELGKTTLEKPFILSVISSPDNINNLDKYKNIQNKIANPYNLESDSAKYLINEGKIVVLISMNIHSTEIGSSQESVELAYELVTKTDSETKEMLKKVIILLIPSLNPDGQQMVTDWYKEYVGTEFEGSSMPWLYHFYAGHDNNRDWFMFNLQESRLTAEILYHEWYPVIVLDQHQMGSRGARLFLPPYSDPINPNVPSLLLAEVNMVGKHIITDLHEQGFKGIVSGKRFNSYFEGTMSKTPLWHNMVGILSEMASVRIATPLYFPRGSLRNYGSEILKYSRINDFLDPWEGGWWHLRDVIDYEKAVTYSLLNLAKTYKEKFMTNFYLLNKQAIKKGKEESPFGIIIPLNQHDPNSASEMLKRLQIGGVDICSSKTDFKYKDKTYISGTFIIPLSQPCRSYIKDLFEVQRYPNLKQYPDGPPKQPYDFTGWTLPFQMGVEVVEIERPIDLQLTIVDTINFLTNKYELTPVKYYVFERRYNNSFTILNELLKDGYEVFQTKIDYSFANDLLPIGTFVIPEQKEVLTTLKSLSKRFEVPIFGCSEKIDTIITRVDLPRIGIYQSWLANMDEGWTRLVLDNCHFKYELLHNEDVKEGNLKSNYDVIIIPSMTVTEIVEGKKKKNSEPIIGYAQKPEKYRDGINEEGVESILEFVKSGGTLITLGKSSVFAIDKLRVPAKNVLQDINEKDFFVPGSLLEIKLDNSHPLSYGMNKNVIVRFTKNSPVFDLQPYILESKAIGYFDENNPLRSGWLIGAEKLAGKTALAVIPVEKGNVIMFGFNPQSRAQTFGTFKLLFNALLL
jgi:hypothetical protein